MSEDSKNNQKKALSRRDFLKLSSTAALAGVAAPQLSKLSFPNVLKGAKMNLKFLTWFWQEAGRGDAWRAMIKKFHDSQSDIHIDEGGFGQEDYFTQILIQAKSGKIDGDFYTATPDVFLRLMRGGHTIPLEDVVKKAGVTLSKAQDSLRKDGQVHGLDIVTVRFGLLYNNALFEKAGVSEPKSIDEWVEASKKLTKKPDQFGLWNSHIPSEPFQSWFTLQQWAVLFDGVWAKGQTPMVTSDPVIKGLKLFKTMYDNVMPQGTDGGTANKLYGAGKIAQQLIVSAAVNVWKNNTDNPDLYKNLRSAKPFWPSGKAITRIHPVCVNSNTDKDKQDAAKEFLAWLYKPDNYRELLERSLDVIPAIEGGIRKEYRDSLTWADGYDAAKAITVPEVLGEFTLYNDEMGQIVFSHFSESLTGSKPVEDAMGEAQKELEALAKRVFTS